MSQSAEIGFQPPPVNERDRADEVVTLGPDDFQRIGIQPKETRLDVIRRAASRAAKSLARKQLNTPNPITEEQLSRIAVSTYRLLDPRQREDHRSRAHVGRIRPGALYRAGRTEFANERILIQSCHSSESSISTHHVEENRGNDKFGRDAAKQDVIEETSDSPCDQDKLTKSAVAKTPTFVSVTDVESIFPIVNTAPGRLARVRRRATGSGIIVTIILTLLATAAAVWFWGQSL